MDENVNNRICEIVREHVKTSYGNPTCVGCIRVLSEVLKALFSLEASPVTVDVEIIPERGAPLRMASNAEKFNGHVVAQTTEGDTAFLWDPSIDQVNGNLEFDEILPFCISQEKLDTDNLWFSVTLDGVLLRYKATNHMDFIRREQAWNIDYSNIVNNVLQQIENELGLSVNN